MPEVTAKYVSPLLRQSVNNAMAEVVATNRPFTSKKLEEVALAVLWLALREEMPGVTRADVAKRAAYAARNFLDTESKNRRIFNTGKDRHYPLRWQSTNKR